MGFLGFGKNIASATVKFLFDGKDVEKGVKKTKKQFSALQKTITGVISGLALKKVGEMTLELANLGAQSELVGKNFENFANKAGRDSNKMMQQLRKATLGMVSDLELQQNAMKAMISGVSFDDMITSMEFVTKFSAATGSNVSQKMTTVMSGLARGSALMLDDVGIQIKGTENVVGRAVDQMKEKMDQFTFSENDAAIKAAALRVEFQNMKGTIGRSLVPAFNDLIDLVNESLLGWTHLLNLSGPSKMLDLQKKITVEQKLQAENLENLDRVKKKEIKNLDDAVKRTENMQFWQDVLIKGKEKENKLQKELNGLKLKAGLLTKKEREELGLKVPKASKIIDGIDDGNKDKKAEAAAKKLSSIRKKMMDDFLNDLKDTQDEEEKLRDELNQELIDAEMEKEEKRLQITDEFNLVRKDSEQFFHDQRIAELKAFGEEETGMKKEVDALIEAEDNAHKDRMKAKDDEAKMAKIANFNAVVNAASFASSSFEALSNATTEKELRNLEKRGLSQRAHEKEEAKINKRAEERSRAFARVQQGIIIARSISNAISASIGIMNDTPGGIFSRVLAMGAGLAAGMAQVATIQKQKFQSGGLVGNELVNTSSRDSVNASLGKGEFVMPSRQTSQNIGLLESIRSNTASTNRLLGKNSGSTIVFQGVSTEQMMSARSTAERRGL